MTKFVSSRLASISNWKSCHDEDARCESFSFFFLLSTRGIVRGMEWMERFAPMFKRNWTEHKRFFTERRGRVERGSLDGNSLSSSCCFSLSWNNEKERRTIERANERGNSSSFRKLISSTKSNVSLVYSSFSIKIASLGSLGCCKIEKHRISIT